MAIPVLLSAFRQERIQPVADRVVTDSELRQAIFRDHSDADLAIAFQKIGEIAHSEAIRYDGFWGWDRTPVGEFIKTNAPGPASA